MTWLLPLPLALSFLAAAGAYLAKSRGPWPRILALAGSSGLLAIAVVLLTQAARLGPLSMQIGGWPAPFGITLVADVFSAVMLVIAGVVGTASAVYSLADGDEEEAPARSALFLTLLGGVSGAFLTGDLFNLYVWFEVMLMASFGLLILGGSWAQISGAVNYVALNLVATVLFLSAVGLTYGLTGALNLADLSLAMKDVDQPALTAGLAAMFLTAFGLKSAVFPLYFWLPSSYHTPPPAVSALFAGLLTKVGVYAMIRVSLLVFDLPARPLIGGLLLVLAAATMISGVLGAYAQGEFRRILSFHVVSQIGYLVLGLALATPLALAGAVFFMAHNIFAKSNLFLIAGAARRFGGSEQLKHLGGLYAAYPFLSFLFIIPAFSLAGFPPFSGFWAKLALIRAGLEAEAYAAAAAALGVGLLTMLSMTKIWAEAFWRAPDYPLKPQRTRPLDRVCLYGPMIGLAALTLALGLFPQPFLEISRQAAHELLHPEAYIAAVLGGRP